MEYNFEKFEQKMSQGVRYRGLHIGRAGVSFSSSIYFAMSPLGNYIAFATDKDQKVVKVTVIPDRTENGLDLFKLGFTVSAKLRDVLPLGRYKFIEQKENEFYFKQNDSAPISN